MSTINPDTFQSSADLSLWFKIRAGEPFSLADMPEIVPLRWGFFRENWPRLERFLSNRADAHSNPDYFRATLEEMDQFVKERRLDPPEVNAFSGNAVYFRFYPVFEMIPVEQIPLTSEERILLDTRREVVQNFSKNDFLKIKSNITAYRDYIADSVNLSDPDYNRIYNRSSVSAQLIATTVDLNLMLVLQGQLNSVNFILANLFAIDAVVDPFAQARKNAQNPDVKIGQYSSGFLVRLHAGEDLQGLATRYLGTPDKWIDIAIANGLREPYVDEIGEQLFFIANGNGNQINVAATSNGRLYINQFVVLQSNTSPFPDQRNIIGIKEVPTSGEIILTLDGEPNLDTYLLSDSASLRIFKPNTVNSSQFVLIPSSKPLENMREDEIPWFMLSSGADEKKTKIDIAVDDHGALQFTSGGDFMLSYGLANAIQAVKLMLSAELGSNRYHPTYGLVNVVGTNDQLGKNVQTQLVESINAQILADGRFDQIESIDVKRARTNSLGAPVAYTISLSVRLANSKTAIPISFAVAV